MGNSSVDVHGHNVFEAVPGGNTAGILDIPGGMPVVRTASGTGNSRGFDVGIDLRQRWVDSGGHLPLQGPAGLAASAAHSRTRHSPVVVARGSH